MAKELITRTKIIIKGNHWVVKGINIYISIILFFEFISEYFASRGSQSWHRICGLWIGGKIKNYVTVFHMTCTIKV